MSETATAEQQTHYEDIPGPTITKGALVAQQKWDDFQSEVKNRESDFAAMLPPHVRKDRFIAAAIAAAKQNPDLLFADKRTLFSALTKAAQDGLLPDGREGVITIYNTKQKDGSYIKAAQWNPMIFGLRKRARELDSILIDAQVVYEKDKFVWHQGDDPHIEHTPANLGTPRGPMIGAYAIFKREDGTVLHREVMDKEQIEVTRNQSKDPDSLMWKKFTTEGWRKTVVRRGVKSVPCSENLEQIVRRDDDLFEFNNAPPAVQLVPPPAPPPAPKKIASQPELGKPQGLPGDWQDYLDVQKGELANAQSASETQAIHDTVADTVAGARERGQISETDREVIMAAWEEMSEK